MFNKKIQGVNFVQIKHSFYHWGILEMNFLKMILHFSFEIMSKKL